MPTELNKTASEWLRFFDRYDRTSLLVILVCLSLIASAIAVLMSTISLSDAKDANIRSEYQDKHIAEIRDEVDVYRVRYANVMAELKARGIELKED